MAGARRFGGVEDRLVGLGWRQAGRLALAGGGRGGHIVPRAVPHDENGPVGRFPKPRNV